MAKNIVNKLISKKKRKRLGARSEKTSHKAPYFSINCDIHGKSDMDRNPGFKALRVAGPKSKHDTGCPRCKVESRQKQIAA